MPDVDEETGDVKANAMILVGIERSNDPDAISCFQNHVPSIVTSLVGREKGVPALNQAMLDAILKDCRWTDKDGIILLVGEDDLQFQPNASADYERVDCVLTGVRPHAPNMGFVGNENYVSKEEQK
jgi:hypothetical protein